MFGRGLTGRIKEKYSHSGSCLYEYLALVGLRRHYCTIAGVGFLGM